MKTDFIFTEPKILQAKSFSHLLLLELRLFAVVGRHCAAWHPTPIGAYVLPGPTRVMEGDGATDPTRM